LQHVGGNCEFDGALRRAVVMAPERTATVALTFGRDAANDVVIGDRKASRVHARIERRRDKYVLVDHSTNGTFCTLDGEGEVELHREELLLRGRGRIVFGHPWLEDPACEAVLFDTGSS
jgi:hypothetical protein